MLPIATTIRPVMRWNLHSNACDVLALGPRTAGQLETVGVRTVADLLATRASVIAVRLGEVAISSSLVSQWQREASLILALPDLPTEAARLLAAADFACVETIAACTPTELLGKVEVAKQTSDDVWLAQSTLPTIATASSWIELACEAKKFRAA